MPAIPTLVTQAGAIQALSNRQTSPAVGGDGNAFVTVTLASGGVASNWRNEPVLVSINPSGTSALGIGTYTEGLPGPGGLAGTEVSGNLDGGFGFIVGQISDTVYLVQTSGTIKCRQWRSAFDAARLSASPVLYPTWRTGQEGKVVIFDVTEMGTAPQYQQAKTYAFPAACLYWCGDDTWKIGTGDRYQAPYMGDVTDVDDDRWRNVPNNGGAPLVYDGNYDKFVLMAKIYGADTWFELDQITVASMKGQANRGIMAWNAFNATSSLYKPVHLSPSAAGDVVRFDGTNIVWGSLSYAEITGSIAGSALPTIIAPGGPVGTGAKVPVITYDEKGRLTAVTTADITPASIGAAAASHTHAISDVTGLTTALAGKADTSHTHAISDVTGLTTALAGKADTSHTHSIAGDVTGSLSAASVVKLRGANIGTSVGSVSGASRPDLFMWWDKTNLEWRTFQLWNTGAVTGWLNCYDPAAGDSSANSTGVMAGTATSVFGRSAATDGMPAAIVASSNDTFLRRVSGTLSWGVATTGMLGSNTVTNTVLRQGAACSIIGRSANSTGNVADISASANGQVLNRKSDTLSWTNVVELGNNSGANGSVQVFVNGATGDYWLIATTGRIRFFSQAISAVTPVIDIDPVGVTPTGGWDTTTKQLKLREIDWNDGSGTCKKALILATGAY